MDLNWGPKQLEGAFGGAYKCYQIDGIEGMDVDMECFKWAVIAADRWEEIDKHPERISKLRKFEEEYDWTDVEFPFTIRSIDNFKRKNEISVNILAVEDRRVFI